MDALLPAACAAFQAFCVLVAPGTTYKADWQVYQRGRPVELLCVENASQKPAYIVVHPRGEKPPEIELAPGLSHCGPPSS